MTPFVLRRAVVPLLFVFPVLQGTASTVAPEVEACIRKNTAKTTAMQKIELRSTDRIGYEKLLFAERSSTATAMSNEGSKRSGNLPKMKSVNCHLDRLVKLLWIVGGNVK